MFNTLSRIGLALALTAAPLLARDTTGAGWGQDGSTPLSTITALSAYDTLSNGDRVVFDGSQAWIEHDDGVVFAFLGATPVAGNFSSFIEVDPSETFAILGESSNGVIYRAPLSGGGLVPLATLVFNYDFAFEPSGTTGLVSAASCGSGCGNRIHRVNLTTGATTLVASVLGPSGPLAISTAGDLYYATQSVVFPTPAGEVDVLRWTAAQITSGPFPLTASHATVFTANRDGGSSLAFDPQSGHLYLGEASYSVVSRVIEIDRVGAVVGIVADSPDYCGKVEVFDAPGAGLLAAFQPPGARLQYRATDFNNATSRVERVSPRRPQLTSVQNGTGTMTISITGATPNSLCFLITCPVALLNLTESAYDLGTYRLCTAMPYPSNVRRLGNQITADANGAGSFTFANPTVIQGTRVIQALVRDASGVFRGASTAVTN